MNEEMIVVAEAAIPVGSDPLNAFAPVSMTISRGETMSIIGAHCALNGAYMRMLAGVEAPYSGHINLLGWNTKSLEPGEWKRIRFDVACITANTHLLSILDGLHNVMLPAEYHQCADDETIVADAWRLLKLFQFPGDAQVLPAFMSELQRRILLLVRSIMLKPKILFIEQPLHGFGTEDRLRFGDLLNEVATQLGIALVMTSPEPWLIPKLSSRVCFIAHDRALYFQNWDELKHSSDIEVRLFLDQEHSLNPFIESIR